MKALLLNSLFQLIAAQGQKQGEWLAGAWASVDDDVPKGRSLKPCGM